MKQTLVSAANGTAADPSIQSLHVQKTVTVAAPLELVWESLLEEMGPTGIGPEGKKMPMKLEAWPGGRWFRDLGDNAGHLWGHVQVIKPPKLLEICGPMFMSYPVASHLQYRLTPEEGGTLLKLTHRAFGQIDPEHVQGIDLGWGQIVDDVRKEAERRAAGRGG